MIEVHIPKCDKTCVRRMGVKVQHCEPPLLSLELKTPDKFAKVIFEHLEMALFWSFLYPTFCFITLCFVDVMITLS